MNRRARAKRALKSYCELCKNKLNCDNCDLKYLKGYIKYLETREQELIDIETPKPVDHPKDGYIDYCSWCGEELHRNYDHCPCCGYKIDWAHEVQDK